MKVTILTGWNVARIGAGDSVQAKKTSAAMQRLGVDVRHVIFTEGNDSRLGPESDVVNIGDVSCDGVDVVHLIPGRLSVGVRSWYRGLKSRPLLVGSTISWDSWVHRAVIEQNRAAIGAEAQRMVDGVKIWLKNRAFGLICPLLPDTFDGFDLLLPNSQAEIQNVRSTLRVSKDTVFASVPNAVDPIPAWVDELVDPPFDYPYVLYPAVFSPRKNQLGFIEAMRNAKLGVVFMGGAVPTPDGERYFERCRSLAPSSWVFTGKVEHGSRRFYELMKHAEVVSLASSCETPGIAALEAAALGTRVAMTSEGSGPEYLGFTAEYFNPLAKDEIVAAVEVARQRGRLSLEEMQSVRYLTWDYAAQRTLEAYQHLRGRRP